MTQPSRGRRGGTGRGSPPSRRDRLRAATIDEIIQTARQLLVKDGPEGVSLRAIAREMGMTAPGLYRYFGSYEELVRHLCAGIFTELGADIHRAIEAAVPPAGRSAGEADRQDGRRLPRVPPLGAEPQGRFALVFGVPLPASTTGGTTSPTNAHWPSPVPSSRCSSSCGTRSRSPSRPTSRSTRACATSSAAIATRWAPASPSARW